MKIATYNVNSIRIRLDVIIGWLEKHKPDVRIRILSEVGRLSDVT